jgi:hypothetical protein
MQTMDRPELQIKKREKTLGIKAFFGLGRHSRLFNKSTECRVPGQSGGMTGKVLGSFMGKGFFRRKVDTLWGRYQ